MNRTVPRSSGNSKSCMLLSLTKYFRKNRQPIPGREHRLSKNTRKSDSTATQKKTKSGSVARLISRKLFMLPAQGKGEKVMRISMRCQIRNNRGRIFDWLLDVFKEFQLSWETYWATLEIFDYLVDEHDYVKIENVLLVGLTCMFISGKIHESHPPRLYYILEWAAHNSITHKQMCHEEMKIIGLCFSPASSFKFFQTPYNMVHEMFPHLPRSSLLEIFKTLLWVRIDPVTALQTTATEIPYRQLLSEIAEDIISGFSFRNAEKVMREFKINQKCLNIASVEICMKYLK